MGSKRTLGNWRLLAGVLALSTGVSATVSAARRLFSAGVQADGSIVIPTGQTLTPAGLHIEVDDRPLGMVLSPSGAELAVVTGSNFSARALHIIDTASKALKQTIGIGDSFVGVDFSPTGDRIYVGGNTNQNVA
ncbi:MAG TPA: hypothetical protein VFH68_16570, partial [Polyangia bacterium]|nr:hypothetical protein [Polyangia bacterium]